MKRSEREEDQEAAAMDISSNCLMLISRIGENPRGGSRDRMYKCKTCNREFSTFQALGGHRASHKKPRLDDMSGLALFGLEMSGFLVKHKMHECSICGLEFPIGQALGGHMRRHRAEMVAEKTAAQQQFPAGGALAKKKPIMPTSNNNINNNNNGMVCLDLNLSPYENDLSLKLGFMACAVDLA